MDKEQRRRIGFSAVYVLVALLGVWLFQQLIFRPLVVRWTEVPYSQFLAQAGTPAPTAAERASDE